MENSTENFKRNVPFAYATYLIMFATESLYKLYKFALPGTDDPWSLGANGAIYLPIALFYAVNRIL